MGMYTVDETVDLKLPIDQGQTPQSIPCKINISGVMKGLLQQHHDEHEGSYQGGNDCLHGGLRYYAVHLTPISKSQHTAGHCQEETIEFACGANNNSILFWFLL